MLRGAIASNPALLAGIIQHLAQNNQALAGHLQNPANIEKLINDPAVRGNILGMLGGGMGAGRGAGGTGGGGMPAAMGGAGAGAGRGMAPGPVPGTNVIRLTPEENAAINRLAAMGFTRQQAFEA